MAFRIRLVSAALLLLSAATTSGQQITPGTGGAPIIQPGAPGHSNKTRSPETAGTPQHAPIEADTSFMQGMIMHHSQAVEMTDLLRTRTRTKGLQALGKRISIWQSDEMKYMKQWLEDRGKPTSMPSHMDHMNMPGMNHMAMGSMPLMPGMLSPQQMQALAKANGKAFDRLFLTGMIQHHTGALIMVQDLFDTPGAGQDNVLFD